MFTTATRYQLIVRDMPRALRQSAAAPEFARETAYYQANIGRVKTADDLIADRRLFAYAMKAHGLESMVPSAAYMRKALKEGIDRHDAFARTLRDPRYAAFVADFNFARYGETTTKLDRATKGIVDLATRNQLEESAGQQDEGVRLALTFQRKAPDIRSPFQLLADPDLRRVVQTTLNLSDQELRGDIDKLAAFIERRIPAKDLQEPGKLERVLTRFTTRWQLDHGTSSGTVAPSLVRGSTSLGLGSDVLLTLQALRKGGP